MAAPQFSASRTKHSLRPKNPFTVREANRSLPLVTRIVRDIVNTHERAAQLQAKIDGLPRSRNATDLQSQLNVAVSELQEYVDELADVGVELKDYETGLVDFPSRHQGRDVYLCWRLGEEKIEYWHELHTGLAGRQPVSAIEET
jgi:hypothetical protein